MSDDPLSVEVTSELYSAYIEAVHLMATINSLIKRGVQFGKSSILPQCHVLVRVFVKFLGENALVVDGFIPTIKVDKEEIGPSLMYHSWIVFEADPGYILDVAPIGSAVGLSMPIIIKQGMYSFEYVVDPDIPKCLIQEDIDSAVQYMLDMLKPYFEKAGE